MNDGRESSVLNGPAIMLLSAAIFAYFGFLSQWTTHNAGGQLVPAWFALKWTIKGSAVAFAVSALVTFVHRWGGNLLYGVVGVVSAVLLVTVIVLDYVDKQHAAAISPVFLALFAAWNGYGAWTGLVGVIAARRGA